MGTTAISKDPVARLAERQSWISPAAEVAAQGWIQETIDRIGGEGLGSALNGDWLHEPLHAVIVEVPVGAWSATAAFDALAAISGSEKLDFAADATLALGLAGAVGAAVTGMTNWSEVEEAAPRKIGAVHALLNVAATGLYVGSLMARRNPGGRSTGRALGMLGYLVVSLSAHLGGNMVYEHGVGVTKSPRVAQ